METTPDVPKLDAQFQVICTEALRAELAADAERFGVSMAQLVRESLDIGLPVVRSMHEEMVAVRERSAAQRVA